MIKLVIKFSLWVVLILNFHSLAYGQIKYLKFIKVINDSGEIKSVYDSLDVPLLIINRSVCGIDSDCISASFAGSKPKNSGGGSIK